MGVDRGRSIDAEMDGCIVLLMSSKWRTESRWFFANYALLNALWFGIGLVWGVVLITESSDGSIPGYAGSGVEQVFWWPVAVVFSGPLVIGVPLLACTLLVWRVAIRVAGHPRLAAYAVAAAIVVAATILIPRTDGPSIALMIAAPALAYATILRTPLDA